MIVCVHMHVYEYVCMSVCVNVCKYINVCMSECVYVCVMCECTCVFILHEYVCFCESVYVCMFVCMYNPMPVIQKKPNLDNKNTLLSWERMKRALWVLVPFA